MSKALEETQLDSEQVFDGVLLKAWRDRVRLPDGASGIREYIRHPGAVVVIAILPNGNLIFERQYRYPLRRVFVELPAGKIDPGETIEACARRELREEAGYEAAQWQHLGVFHPCIGYSDERIEIFVARELSHVGAALDEEEFLELTEMSLDDAVAGVYGGRITDAKTICALFWAIKALGREGGL